MSAPGLRGFFFANAAQWRSCRFESADAGALQSQQEVRPYAPYGQPGMLFESVGAFAPVVTGAGDVLWRDAAGCLHRLERCADVPEVLHSPAAFAGATRAAYSGHGIWVLQRPSSLYRYEEDSLTRVLAVDVPPDLNVIDIAGAARGSVTMLVDRDGALEAARVEHTGRLGESTALSGLNRATGFVLLRRLGRLVVLDDGSGGRDRLQWFSEGGGRPLFSVRLAAIRPCFEAMAIGSDGRDRIFVAGADGAAFAGERHVLIFDADGNMLGDVPIDPAYGMPTGVTATRNELFVAVETGLLRFASTDVMPDSAFAEAIVLTPMLHAPDQQSGRRWLRAEATADLPEGCTLEFLFASTDNSEERDRINEVLANPAVPEAQRVRQLLRDATLWHGHTVFSGTAAASPDATPFSAKLFETRDRYLWAAVTLHAAPGSRLPRLTKLAVLYPGSTLMESLPAIYRAEDERAGGFLRGLVGVLETTSQGLDARIASLGRRIHPATASGPWLDFVARWLGLPWDDGMTLEQKRRIVQRASDLGKGRGTRSALESLLEALMPSTPRRFRVTDPTADVGFAIVGGPSCQGSRLPAMLGGRTRWHGELDSDAVLGYTRLPCAGQLDDGVWQLAGRVRVDIGATAGERQAWEPWLPSVIAEMVPLTARLDLRWVAPRALRGNALGDELTLESAPDARLGSDALTGLARLPDRGARLSSSGASLSTRLR